MTTSIAMVVVKVYFPDPDLDTPRSVLERSRHVRQYCPTTPGAIISPRGARRGGKEDPGAWDIRGFPGIPGTSSSEGQTSGALPRGTWGARPDQPAPPGNSGQPSHCSPTSKCIDRLQAPDVSLPATTGRRSFSEVRVLGLRKRPASPRGPLGRLAEVVRSKIGWRGASASLDQAAPAG